MPLWQRILVGPVLCATTYCFGGIAFAFVVDSEAGQTEWMKGVTSEARSGAAAFFLVPTMVGLGSAWAVHRIGLPYVVTLLSGPVVIAVYLVLLVAIGTPH